ncbi:hypothetical protein OSB04_012827 [Centaurea solstitialis]|uniref:Purple acid phosphatase n=1 Tax=Centaurea solstitialis TaxID=347529 RepID=A0AA38TJK7_9ASTR|nr:hypothetical protein OSB04_012827 [Centaurea solstitialis]
MERPYSFLLFVLLFTSTILIFGVASSLHKALENSMTEFGNHTAISDFRLLNRRSLIACKNRGPYVHVNVSSIPGLSDEQYVTVTINGVLKPSKSDWVAMISPSDSSTSACAKNAFLYLQTGDLSLLPLLCHYPVKQMQAQYVSNDLDYLGCKKQECQEYQQGRCIVTTCGATLTFHVINIRTDIEFVLFGDGFLNPCIITRSSPINFKNPNQPLYGHLSSIDSTGTTMRLTWVSGDNNPQHVQYGDGKSQASQVATFTQDDMCSSSILPSPAKDFGWHDPGYIHSAVMTGLNPSTPFSYRYGSDSVGWSNTINFRTPPAAGAQELKFLAFGDMGKAPRDASSEHFIQPGSLSVMEAIASEVSTGSIDSIFHIGDISYATGFLVEWDYFLHLISPIASKLSYMTAIGNHESLYVRDYVNTGSVYPTPDSGGECGVAYETYFPMPTPAKDKPWYSIELGSVHFTVISTEHDWSLDSEQYQWMSTDMASVDRSRTPWLIFTGHRPMYSSSGLVVDNKFVQAVEPLLLAYKVDLALFGHVHNYERTCAVYQKQCNQIPIRDGNGVDTYNNTNYAAPVHAAGWSLVRIKEFGYVKVQTTTTQISFEFVNANTRKLEDRFRIIKS